MPDPALGSAFALFARPGRRVLVVDDDAAVCELIAEGLEELGYSVLAAASGEAALALLLNSRGADRRATGANAPVLAIIDAQLPRLSGLDLAERLLAARPALKVLMISGYFVPRGVPWRVLRKPFHMDQLAAAVREEIG